MNEYLEILKNISMFIELSVPALFAMLLKSVIALFLLILLITLWGGCIIVLCFVIGGMVGALIEWVKSLFKKYNKKKKKKKK